MDILPQIPSPAKRWQLDEENEIQFRIRTSKIKGNCRNAEWTAEKAAFLRLAKKNKRSECCMFQAFKGKIFDEKLVMQGYSSFLEHNMCDYWHTGKKMKNKNYLIQHSNSLTVLANSKPI